jgi:hypothetical protein
MPKAQAPKRSKASGPYSIRAKAIKPVAKTVLELASQVALGISQKTNWSFWHIWDHCRTVDARKLSLKQQLERYKFHWANKHNFGTCIDLAHLAQQRLQYALANHQSPKVRALANQVQMLALWGGHHKNLEVVHCATALFLPESCIVIDTVYELDAFLVPMNGYYESMQHISFVGSTTGETYYYGYDKAGDYLLRQSGVLSDPKDPAPEFVPILYDEALEHGNFRIGRSFNRGNSGISTRRYLNVNKIMTKEPKAIDSVEVSSGWLAVTLRMSMDYTSMSIVVQVPQRDYLGLRANVDVQLELDRLGLLKPISGAVSNIELKLVRKGKMMNEHVDAVVGVVRDLGLAEVEFWKIVDSVVSYEKRKK